MRRPAAHRLVLFRKNKNRRRIVWCYLEKTKIKTGIVKSLLVRGPEGKMVDLEVLSSVGFK